MTQPTASGPASDVDTSAILRQRRWHFRAAAYSLFAMLACTNLPTPLYRAYAQQFGFSPLTITLIFSVYVLALVPSLLIFGPLSDAVGKRKVLVAATLVAIGGLLVFVLARSTAWLYAARILQGISVGAASGTLTAALSDLEPQGQRHRAALAATVASLCGLSSGPLITGVLAQYGPAPLVTPYLFGLALLVVMFAAMLRHPDVRETTTWRMRKPSIPREMRRVFTLNSATSFIAFSVMGLFLALVPSFAMELTHTTNLVIAGGAVTLMLLTSLIAQVFCFGQDTNKLQIAGLGVLALGLALLLVAGRTASPWLLLMAALITGTGHGMAFLGGITEINQLAPSSRHAEVLSSYYVVVYLGVGVPVISVGFLALHYGLLNAVGLFAYAVVPLCVVMAGTLWINEKKR